MNGFDLEPVLVSLGPIRRISPLRDDALPVELGGMLEHRLTVAGEMLRVEDREFNVVFAEKVQQRLFALNLWKAAEITITPKEIEGVVDEPICLRQLKPLMRKVPA